MKEGRIVGIGGKRQGRRKAGKVGARKDGGKTYQFRICLNKNYQAKLYKFLFHSLNK